MSPILNAMRTYLAPAFFNSKVNELKRHVPKMQTSNQYFKLFNKCFTVGLKQGWWMADIARI